MLRLPAQCLCCKHYRPQQPGDVCDAYPDLPAIPPAILDDEHDHRQPYAGDQGIRWEPKEPGVRHPLDQTARPQS